MTFSKAPQRLPPHVEALIAIAAKKHHVREALARGVAWTESRGNQRAVGTSGELGVMQLMPATAKGLGVDASDIAQNIDGGVRLLAGNVKKFGEQGGLAAYNAGPRYGNFPPERWPLTTQRYVPAVLARAAVEDEIMRGARAAADPFPSSEATPVQRRRSSSPPPPSQSHSQHGGCGEDDP